MDDRADALVLFGATGDLVRKKLIPALSQLSAGGRLDMPVVGVARSGWTDDRLRDHVRTVLADAGGSTTATVEALTIACR